MAAIATLNPSISIPIDKKNRLLDIFKQQGKSIDEGFSDMALVYIDNFSNDSDYLDSLYDESKPTKHLVQAMKEADDIALHPDNYKQFHSLEEMLKNA